MKHSWRKAIAIAFSFLLTVSAASCASPSNAVSGTDVMNGVGADDGKSNFIKGVWAADDGSTRLGYYIFNDETSGSYLSAETGTGVGFDVEGNESRVNFHMGAADVNEYARVAIVDKGKRVVYWDTDNRMENWDWLSGYDPDDFRFYAAQELAETALQYYGNRTGEYQMEAGYQVNTDGMVMIQIYRQINGHNSTAAFYEVDSITGKGMDVNEGTSVDFSTPIA